MAVSREEAKDIGRKAGASAWDDLRQLAKTNLVSEYQRLYDLSEEAIHFSGRCNLDAMFNRLNSANRAAIRLNERARERFEDGLITGEECVKIVELTEEIVFRETPGRIRRNLVQECNCKLVD